MQTESTDLEASVLDALEHRGPLHVTDVADVVGSHPLLVEGCCARLVTSGEITTPSCGVYDRE